ncbi:DUF5723 family protein [Coprobacter tertius]|uniref:DUF5723 family protein n=1 Tax=Coprobacter tertius TaxID=2944915 RepID=A0ABT1MKE4_9BACT|nr:DUF5723 family protein [Coprobacter tertius]MCP9613098.1 DUF5723 family protein [Coprobacter tertius]
MKQYKMRSSIITFILLLTTISIGAQNLHSSYFLERMPYRHRLNPALINDYGYFSFPILGNIAVGLNSNIGISTFLYPSLTKPNELNTFLHPDVDFNKFEKKLKNMNQIEPNFEITILSFGFFAFNGFNTFDLSVRSTNQIFLPKDFFTFLKLGQTGDATEYNISDMSIKSNTFAQLALGHAHEINDKLTIGAKLKFLVGGANIDAKIDKMNILLSDNKWYIRSYGQADVSMAGASLKVNNKGEIDGFDLDTPGIGGFGGAVDLGATYKLLDNLTLSMALTDIGFIRWNNNLRGVTPDKEFIFEGFEHIGAEDGPNGDNAFDDETDKFTDDLEALAKFNKADAPAARNTMLYTTMNIGAEYGILNNKISFGLLSSTRFSTPKVWTELMGTVNFRPARWFMAAVNGSVSNMGCAWGAVINLCPRGFNLFIGTDYMITRVNSWFIPVDRANFNINFGINFPMSLNPKLKNKTVYKPVPY